MKRHIIDTHRAEPTGKRAAVFLHIERRLGRHSASRVLHERPKLSGPGRLREFLRIERGRRA